MGVAINTAGVTLGYATEATAELDLLLDIL